MSTTLKFKIHGMDCAEEVALLKKAVGPKVGGEDRHAFDILNAKMTVAAASAITSEAIIDAVRGTGLRAERWQDKQTQDQPDRFWERRGRLIMTVASGVFLAAGFLSHVVLAGSVTEAFGSEGMGLAHQVPALSRVLYAAAIVCGAWFVAPKAWFSLKQLQPDMNLLMVIAVAGGIAIGEWFEAATVAFLFALSLTLEAWSVGRARRAIQALVALAPQTVRLVEQSGNREVPAAQVAVGARFHVRPGEKIPLDGEILTGTGGINEAPITGESLPITKGPGAVVFAGTINGDSALEVRSTKAAGDTTLAHIIRLVGEASGRRAASERWVDGFARVYTPAVMLLALGVLLVPPLLFGQPWQPWIYRSLVFLVIGCPCALVISTPVTIVAALAAAAKNGVLIKGGIHVETPASLQAVALDKTGTLTEGRPRVEIIVALAGHPEREMLADVAGMESQSDHPIAKAIVDYAREQGVAHSPVQDFRVLQGKGATGVVGSKQYWIGSHRYLEERQQETADIHTRLEEMTQAGRTVVVVGRDDHVCGFVALADAVRPEARNAIEALRAQGIRHIVMLTGDNRGTAQAVAERTGVDEVHAELLPADKVALVEALVKKYGHVAMIGDGVNDAPALARSTLGIAMGAAGSDAAIETADVALMSDDLAKVPWLIRHSKRAVSIIRQNIALSLIIKGLFVVLTFLGHASLWAAIAADMGVSLVVITNALRLLKGTATPNASASA